MSETSKPVKLTTAQKEALADLLKKPRTWNSTWAPGFHLMRQGLAERTVNRFGSATYTITDLGRAHPAVTKT